MTLTSPVYTVPHDCYGSGFQSVCWGLGELKGKQCLEEWCAGWESLDDELEQAVSPFEDNYHKQSLFSLE